MATALGYPAVQTQPPLKMWTRAEVDALDAAGLLAGTRYELIEGELFDKMGQKPPHSYFLNKLAAFLVTIFGFTRVRMQEPIEAAVSERERSLPEPDLAVTRDDNEAYRKRHPEASDVLLLCEVSYSTSHYDLKRKAKLYARAGFTEYVVVDLQEQEMVVHRKPLRGIYSEILVLQSGDSFHPLASPESSIDVGELLASPDLL